MIHVVARSIEQADLVKMRHPSFHSEIEFHFGTKSYLELINKIMSKSDSTFCIIHDDVFLPKNFLLLLDQLISQLDSEWPNWGVCGNAGVLPFQFGKQKNQIVRYLSDPHGGPNAQAMILPAQLIDGNVMLVNSKVLKNNDFVMPSINGFQFYDTALCIAAIVANCAVLVAPQLCCYHDSRGSQNNFDLFVKTAAAGDFLSENVKNKFITTLNGIVPASVKPFRARDSRIDLEIDSLKMASYGRPTRQVAIVVRTQFKNDQFLRRNLETCCAFISEAGDTTEFKLYVITDKLDLMPSFVDEYAEVISVCLLNVADSRNILVKKAFELINADWFWFIDDDDWMFPNEAERLSYILSTIETKSMIFVGSQHFLEMMDDGPNNFLQEGYSITSSRYFDPNQWFRSIEGENHIPFSGMIISNDVYKNIDQSIFTDVTYYEDFALQLSSLADSSRFIVIVDKLYVGISVRPSGNTITEKDRTKWNMSLSELSSKVCNDKNIKYLSRI